MLTRLSQILLLLLTLTLITTIIAEQTPSHKFSVILICFVVTIKADFVIDRFVGMIQYPGLVRHLMRAYFYVLMTIIAMVTMLL